jgi:hypothetical protein
VTIRADELANREATTFTQVNVFSADPLGGNPLAVLHTAEGLRNVVSDRLVQRASAGICASLLLARPFRALALPEDSDE